MAKKRIVLVVGSQQGPLVQTLGDMPVNVISCGTLDQAQEILSREDVQTVFCDEILPDGSFRELVASAKTVGNKPQVVVIFRIGEWAEYLEALQLGAFEVIACPVRAADVQSAVIRSFKGIKATESRPMYQQMSA